MNTYYLFLAVLLSFSLIGLFFWIVMFYPKYRIKKMVKELKSLSSTSQWNSPLHKIIPAEHVYFHGKIDARNAFLVVRYNPLEHTNNYTFLGVETLKSRVDKKIKPVFYGNMFNSLYLHDFDRDYISSASIEEKFNHELLRGVIDMSDRQVIFYNLGDREFDQFNRILDHLIKNRCITPAKLTSKLLNV